MTIKFYAAIALGGALMASCGPATPDVKSDGAAMPTPTVSVNAVDMPAGTQLSTLSMINAKVRKPMDGRPTAGYVTIENSGTAPERLTALSSPDFGRVEVHDHITEGTMKKMVKLDGLDIAPASQAVMEPGGKHLMMFEPKRALNNGDSIKVTLTFSNSGPIETNFVVLNEIPRSGGIKDDAMGDHKGH
jgi:periplasmic copper chaperone A